MDDSIFSASPRGTWTSPGGVAFPKILASPDRRAAPLAYFRHVLERNSQNKKSVVSDPKRFRFRLNDRTPFTIAGTAMVTGSYSAKRNTFALVGLRIAVGCLFLIFAQYKVFGTQFTLGGGFQWWINRFLQDSGAYPFMVPVLQQIALPHATAIAFLVAYGELAIGLALVCGIWVRTASVFGFFYMLCLLFSSNYPGAHAPLWQYFGASLDHSVLALCFLTFVSSRSDEALSLRHSLRGKRYRHALKEFVAGSRAQVQR